MKFATIIGDQYISVNAPTTENAARQAMRIYKARGMPFFGRDERETEIRVIPFDGLERPEEPSDFLAADVGW